MYQFINIILISISSYVIFLSSGIKSVCVWLLVQKGRDEDMEEEKKVQDQEEPGEKTNKEQWHTKQQLSFLIKKKKKKTIPFIVWFYIYIKEVMCFSPQ